MGQVGKMIDRPDAKTGWGDNNAVVGFGSSHLSAEWEQGERRGGNNICWLEPLGLPGTMRVDDEKMQTRWEDGGAKSMG